MKDLKIIEPSVIRLTSDETRMLMKAAVNPKGISMPYNATGVKELGLVRQISNPEPSKAKLARHLRDLQRLALSAKTWNKLASCLKQVEEAKRKLNYATKPEKLFVLTEAGKKLVSSITIRRR